MKALTLWQPWASLTMLERPCDHPGEECIVEHPVDRPATWKTIETRSWPAPVSVLGQRIAIHAAVRWPKPDEMQILAGPYPDIRTRPSVDPVGAQPRLPLGAIIGTAVLTDCVPMVDQTPDDLTPYLLVCDDRLLLAAHPPYEADVEPDRPFGIYDVGRWAWLLGDPIPCDPITTKGAQGLWNVPAHLEERLRG